MKLSKFDIGAEIISIITKGMYPDPKDALREYVQNGIDAKAKKISIKIRQESRVIEDDGYGMNRKILRDAVRMGVSDKNPSKDVGFMGIGIYSSFHLCGQMTIYSRGSEDIPNILTMNFGKMKELLHSQKLKRQEEELESADLIDLQSLLETCIELTENNDVDTNEFPNQGTRVELSHVEGEFYSTLSDFDEVAEYLRNVIPLHFDSKNFNYAELIEKTIADKCKEKNLEFEIIDLSLQVNSRVENLYRPYRNDDFKSNKPLYPIFHDINNSEFFGLAWGCLNSARAKLANKSIRGFILKKQGFSIGTREKMVKYFPRANTYFDRYTGEIIIINPKILPNAARDDIEYSSRRSTLLKLITDVAGQFDEDANKYQEETKADDDLVVINESFKIQIANYNEYEEDTEALVQEIVKVKKIIERLGGRINRGGFSDQSKEKAKELLIQVKEFERTIQTRIRVLTEKKRQKSPTKGNLPGTTQASKLEIAKNVNEIEVDEAEEEKEYDDLIELLNDLEFELDDNLKNLFTQIDELFIQGLAKSKTEYHELLQTLKDRFEDELE